MPQSCISASHRDVKILLALLGAIHCHLLKLCYSLAGLLKDQALIQDVCPAVVHYSCALQS